MKYTSFTQTEIWAQINKIHNNLEPATIEHGGISCLFGIDDERRSMTSYNGPVLSIVDVQTCRDYLRQIILFARKKKIEQINFKNLPPWCPSRDMIITALLANGFRQQPWQTRIIDLGLPPQELFNSFQHSARKSIRKAQKAGVIITRCSSFISFYEQYLLPYLALKNRTPQPIEVYQQSWDLDQDRIYNYWIAKSPDDQTLGFLGTYRYNGVATEIMSALTTKALTQKIPAQDLLHYEIINFHQALGDKYFDLAGFNPQPTNTKEINIRRFKEKWGGEVYDISSYMLDNRSTIHKIKDRVMRFLRG